MEDEGGDLERKGGKYWERRPTRGSGMEGGACASKRMISFHAVTKTVRALRELQCGGNVGDSR